MLPSESIIIYAPTFGHIEACIYSVFVGTVIILCCMNDYVITFDSENIEQPLKYPSLLKNESPDILHLYEEAELSMYNGIQRPEMYLSITGNVFDVSKAKNHYGPGTTYHIFVGRDNSRSFITGQFITEAISDDILSLPPNDVVGIQNWLNFYKKTYTKKGKLIGRYYDSSGKLTPYGRQARKLFKKSDQDLANKAAVKQRFPECNVEWEPQKGSKLWCSNQSGGIQRDWEGLPKELFLPGSQPRCACIKETEGEKIENIKSYKNCEKNNKVCYVQINEKDEEIDYSKEDNIDDDVNNRSEL